MSSFSSDRGCVVGDSGLTAPNGPAQQALLREALHNAQLQPHEVGYIEAHGTGTPLGDPIEVGALTEVFGKGRIAPLYLGSVKTNIGHLEAAAGMMAAMETGGVTMVLEGCLILENLTVRNG